MHPVLEHILARKGKSVPINDGRKIALVLFGGTMTGVRGGGAVAALEELGLSHSFDEIYAVSCGFPNASYLLANDTKRGTSIYYEELSGHKFINLFRLWKLVDIDYLMDVFKRIKPLDTKKILSYRTKVFVGVKNISTHNDEYLQIHNYSPSEYFDILEAAISLPYLHPGSTTIRGSKYMDLGFSGENGIKHLKTVLQSDATDILVIYNRIEQRKTEIPKDDANRVFEILPDPSWQLRRLETDSHALLCAAQQIGDFVKQTFGEDEPINLDYAPRS